MNTKELIGISLGTCTLERVIGKGGMGSVYLAQQARPVRTVAVKVLLPDNENDPEQQRIFLARFRREADTVAKLEHQNILPIYEYDEAVVHQQRLAYLVMPFVRGGTLRERIDEMRRSGTYFDLSLVASYISQIADALSYAHGLGVVHRDVKPSNLLFHLDGRLLLADFGIVRLRAMPALTSVGSFLGTAEYASPEQINSGEIDYRSDIYSLGVILYELLTERLPYTGTNAFAIMAMKLNEPVPSVRDRRPELSPAIEAVVMRAMAKNPTDRYQSAIALATDFSAAIHSPMGIALPVSNGSIHSDFTISEQVAGGLAPLIIRGPASNNALPPTRPAYPSQPGIAMIQGQGQGLHALEIEGAIPGKNGGQYTPGPAPITFRKGRRLFLLGAAIIALLMQFPTLLLLFVTYKTEIIAMLGVLIGSSINLMLLAATAFTAVTRQRKTRKFIVRSLIASLLAPFISGIFVNFGGGVSARHPAFPIIAYLILLASNLYALRQLAKVDAAREQIEVAPVLWRPAMVGALTGLLPLAIIFVFALQGILAPSSYPLASILGILLILFVGTPTPGAVMAVSLSQKNMRYPTLLRSSAIAGMFMFFGAFFLLLFFGLLFANGFATLGQSWLILLICASILGVIGALRGMLDAWIYQKIRGRRKKNAVV